MNTETRKVPPYQYQIVIVLNGSYDPENPLTHMGSAGVSFENKEDAQDWVALNEPLLREKNVMGTFNSDTHYFIVGGEEDLDVSLLDFTPTAPRFPTGKDAPRFPTDEDDDEEWISNTTATEKDEVIPYSLPMPYPTGNEEEWDDEDANEDFSIGWRYYPTPENPDAWIAVAPSRRALRAYIRDGRILRNNPKVVRVSYRR